MLNRTDPELAACRRLMANKDFKVFMGWLGRELASTQSAVLRCDQPVALHVLQGRGQILQEALSATEQPPMVMDVLERSR